MNPLHVFPLYGFVERAGGAVTEEGEEAPLEWTRNRPFTPHNNRIVDFPLQRNAVNAAQEGSDTEMHSGQDIPKNIRKNYIKVVSVPTKQAKGEIFIIG